MPSSLKWPRNDVEKYCSNFETYREKKGKGKFTSHPTHPQGQVERGKKGKTHFFEFVARDPGRQRGEGKQLDKLSEMNARGCLIIDQSQEMGNMVQVGVS